MTILKLLPAAVLALSATAVFADEPAAQAAPAAEATPSTALVQTCLRETGSRLPSGHGDCLSGSHGATYDRGQLLTGGAGITASAVLSYDPAIHIRRK